MDRRYGEEGKYGIGGGGIVSEESQRNLEIAEDLCRKGRPNDAVSYLKIALNDRNNFDAEIQMAYLSPDLLFSVEVLESAEKRGLDAPDPTGNSESLIRIPGIARDLLINRLGAECFDDDGPCVGKFCDTGLLLTRPYMRVLQALVRMCFETKQYEKGCRTIIEMLRLSPGDNLNQRWWLAPLLIRTGRFSDALFFCQVWIHSVAKGGGIPIRGGTAFQAPSDTLLIPETEEEYARTAGCGMAHNAALAAFKLWGPSPQAAQFLHIAARTNPGILAKIIGRRGRPTEGKLAMHTSFNGTDEAHDYLWVAQDLWMAPDVWAWVNENSTVAAVILKCCSRLECPAQETEATQFKRCGACQQVVYCSSTCQKADWKKHKPECARQVEAKKNMKNLWKNKPPIVPVYVLDGKEVHNV
ncbi:hypothetical protein MVEN_00604500 [Mycena venus]|uniref:MYND-type domain-containing protein n=1 Tax=Mycena venus TaxID=2733690 RepID=A0A8H7D7R9_9AGAR|nr:hypothetical protein MVEN_00604500 [Mycena venus]